MTKIGDWDRTIWRQVGTARERDGVLCTWENEAGLELSYVLADDDAEHKYEIRLPNGEQVGEFDTRGNVREAATDYLRVLGVIESEDEVEEKLDEAGDDEVPAAAD